jgi:hypothetical protein
MVGRGMGTRHSFQQIIQEAFPEACSTCRENLFRLIPYALHKTRGRDLGRDGGMGRGRLNNSFGRHGFPPLRVIRDWILVLYLLAEFESRPRPLTRIAWDSGLDPSTCHRVIRRRTGISWEPVKDRGLDFWIQGVRRTVGAANHCSRGNEKDDRKVYNML